MSPSQHVSRNGSPRVTRRALLAAAGAAAVAGPLAGSWLAPSDAESAPPRTTAGDPAAIAKRLRRPFSDDAVAAAIAALALVGVGVYASPAETDPLLPISGVPSPLRLLEWQVTQMAHETATGNGLTGSELDDLIPPPKGSPPPALLLAAYASEAATPGGKLVRALLGKRKWSSYGKIVFPGLAQAIFVGELAQAAAATSASTGPRATMLRSAAVQPRFAPAAQPAGVCSAVGSWVDGVLNSIANALKVNAGGGVLGFLGSIWNTVVDLGKAAIKGLIEQLTAPVVAVVKSIATAVAVASQVISLIKPWNVIVTPDPAATKFGVGAEKITGAVTVGIDTGFGGDWPPTVHDCAAQAGVPLPSLNGANSPVTWTVTESPIDLIAVEEQADALDADGHAKLSYVTNQEDPETAKGDPHTGTVGIVVDIKRDDLTQLKNTLSGLLFSSLPDFVAKVLRPTLGSTVDSLLGKIVALAPAHASASFAVTFHEPPKPTPKPAGGKSGEGAASGCPYGRWSVTNLAGISESLVQKAAGAGAPKFTYTEEGGSGAAEFRGDGTFTWTYNQYRTSGTADVPQTGVLLVTMLLNGTATGKFTVKDGTLVLGDVSNGFALSGENYINGVDIGPVTDLEPSLWLPSGGKLALACGSKHMTLTPLWIDVDEGFELTAI